MKGSADGTELDEDEDDVGDKNEENVNEDDD